MDEEELSKVDETRRMWQVYREAEGTMKEAAMEDAAELEGRFTAALMQTIAREEGRVQKEDASLTYQSRLLHTRWCQLRRQQ